jgi:zinc protease
LLEKYLGSLPNTGRKEMWKDNNLRPLSGKHEKVVVKGSDPKSFVQIGFTGEEKEYNDKNAYLFSALADLLDIKLIEKIREEASGAYSVGAEGNFSKLPRPSYSFFISFPCDPKRVDELTKLALDEVEKIQKGEIDAKDLDKVKEQRKRKIEVDIKTNRFWASNLQNALFQGQNPEYVLDWEKRLEWISKENLQNIAKKYLNTKEYLRCYLKPEDKK